MSFIIDKQTLNDLNIFGKIQGNSLYSLFNHTHTRGGALILEEIFRYPLSDADKINKRSSIIRYFAGRETVFPFENEWFDTMEYYLSNTDSRTRLSAEDNTLQRKLRGYLGADNEYEQLQKGVLAGIRIINCLPDFLHQADDSSGEAPYEEEFRRIGEMLLDPHLNWALQEKGIKKLSYEKIAGYDRMFRYEGREQVKKLLSAIYQLDVYLSVAQVAQKYHFTFGKALPPGGHTLNLEGIYHPLVPHAIANSLQADGTNNLIFLTGANMAGKSTFMKTFGIVIFLAHMGFPLPAQRVEFTVQNGMFTTINLPDNLNMGYSHFYAEVLRVKKVAEQVSRSENLIVIFDELFRGTNVKDAYDATVAVAEAFAGKRNSTFLISTHIIEAGIALKQNCPQVQTVYLPTVMNGNTPSYPYTLKSGITNDRHGMMIIRNERIPEILKHPGAKLPEVAKGNFAVDKQTLEDLNLVGKYKKNSVFSLYNATHTRGGEQLLEQMFRQPLTDADAINTRGRLFTYFRRQAIPFPIDKELLERVEHYLSTAAHPNRSIALINTCRRKFLHSIASDKEYVTLYNGLVSCMELLQVWNNFNNLLKSCSTDAYSPLQKEAGDILGQKQISGLLKKRDSRLSWFDFARYDHFLRATYARQLKQLLHIIYETDVYISVAGISEKYGFTPAIAHAPGKDKNNIEMQGLFHPCLPESVANDIRVDEDYNVIFLTGANMAGKSTLMKSFAIAVYLAHMGFPVAVGRMAFSVCDGLYTSINVSDNLNMGYSHFYAEVLRVKQVAEEVASGKNLVVIFDELFKGTNVKDAYDATVAVTEAFSAYRHCSFIISTHITEAGHTLQERCNNFRFVYLPTLMQGTRPTYTYRLAAGITNDRHGMMIIKNERILERIRGQD